MRTTIAASGEPLDGWRTSGRADVRRPAPQRERTYGISRRRPHRSTTTQNLSTLLDGTITLTAYTVDAAGNVSATTTSTGVLIKDTAIPPLTASYSGGLAGLDPEITGAAECGAAVKAVRTGGGDLGATYTTTIGSGTAYTLTVGARCSGSPRSPTR